MLILLMLGSKIVKYIEGDVRTRVTGVGNGRMGEILWERTKSLLRKMSTLES